MLMKIGLCHLVVLNDGTSFKVAFVAIRKVLKLNYNILAKRNYKGLSMEHSHRFLIKATTIAMEYHQCTDVIVPVRIAKGCE